MPNNPQHPQSGTPSGNRPASSGQPVPGGQHTPGSQQASSGHPSTHLSAMRQEITAKWGKFTAAEISALRDKDHLVTLVQAKYNIDKAQAQRDVDAFFKGRQL